MSGNRNSLGVTIRLFLTSMIFLVCTRRCATTYEVHRIDEFRPQCQPISTPLCMPLDYQAFARGRYVRSTFEEKERSKVKLRMKRKTTLNIFEWKYNTTTFPNFANDETPEDVADSLRKLHPIISTACSKYLNLFLCSVYSPVCTEFGVVPPCKELCEIVMNDCEKTIREFGIELPDSIMCSLFPSFRDKTGIPEAIEFFGEETSYDGDSAIMIQRVASLTWMGSLADEGKVRNLIFVKPMNTLMDRKYNIRYHLILELIVRDTYWINISVKRFP